ncbi:SPOR domain-containing protein [Bowmanella sp. JS7-9]|uniref:SPOR domain-containing protein n=1 Tax=Pseudobowmanella zhangzhouensis TaxID=1537679 RepID=A0ABW1XMK7_9ALTE|nr:SPOR domain-containing protein [Bowmanella sp. JS7-9]TBX22549.1 hypothetical protein TK45_08895 [Bowmanella sp. JS7-9]
MSSAFQNRLVGTIAIVAIAVIFLPDLLDGEKIQGSERFVSVPPRPATDPIRGTQPFPQEQVNQATARKVEVVSQQAQDEQLNETPIVQASEAGVKSENPTDTDVAKTEVASEQDTQTLAKLAKQAEQEDQALAGWVVQLGVFRHDANVKSLLKKLEDAGYRAFSRKIQTTSGPLNKVFVGPDLDQQKLQNAIPHLKQVTGLQGRVAPYAVN